MGRKRKTLLQLVKDGTFLARRPEDRELLLGEPLEWAAFASLQARYANASSEPERRAIALDFERLVRQIHAEAARIDGTTSSAAASLAAELEALGKAGSAKQLLAFFPSFLSHTRGPLRGEAFELEAWQKQFLKEFCRRDNHGRRIYRLGVLSVPRGNGKTPLAAGLALYELLTRTDAPEIVVAAGSREQAGILFRFCKEMVENGPLADWISATGKKLVCAATGGTLEVISSEGSLQHGRAPSAAIIDELHVFETARQEETYCALATALHKRPDSYMLVITTAGHNKQSLLGQIYETALDFDDITTSRSGCLTVARDSANGSLVYWYGAPDGCQIDDTKLWRKANPASWLQLSDLKKQLNNPGLDERAFRRLHLNQWTSVKEPWLPDGLWASLASEAKIPQGGSIYLGVDIGISHDTSAVAWAHPLPDGRIIVRSRVWAPDDHSPAHTRHPDTIQLEAIENFILDHLKPRYKIEAIAYDPRYFQRSAQLLEKKGLKLVQYDPAANPTSNAYQTFYQLAREHKITHHPTDRILAAHIEATAARKTERGWKLHRLNPGGPIDATIAASLAVDRAHHHKPKPKPRIDWIDA